MRKTKEALHICKRLIALLGSLKYMLFLAVLFGASGNLMATALTSYGAYGLAQVLQKAQISFAHFALILFGLAVVRSLMRYLEQLANHYVAFKTLHIIRDKVFQALRRLSPAKLDGKNKGELISLVTTDIELLEVFYAHTISPVLIALVHTAVLFFFLLQIHLYYALLLLFFHLLMAVFVPWISSKSTRNVGKQQRESLSALNSLILDTFSGIKECIQYAYGSERLQRINNKTDELNQDSKRLSQIAGSNMSISMATVLAANLCVLLLSALLLQNDFVSLGNALIAITLLMSSFGPTSALASLVNNLIITFSCGRRVLDLLDEEPIVEDIAGKADLSFQSMDVDGLTFAYMDENIVLEDISFSLRKGEILGVEGKSGAGKSTLLKLLMRFFRPNKGSIRINGIDIEDINTASLRTNQSYVSQSTYLFMGTVLENIRLAKQSASLEEVKDACKKALIHEFIESLPKGYDTPLDSIVNVLSTGEAQRIGLARAFLSEAPMMILDEPSSNIDSLNEGLVLKSLYAQSKDKAMIIVSHRKSTLRIANKRLSIVCESES